MNGICFKVVAEIGSIFATLSTLGTKGASTALVIQTSFIFMVISLISICIMFSYHIVKHNRVSDANNQINTMKDAWLFFGTKLILLPLIIASPALPIMTRSIAANFNVWESSYGLSQRVAKIGDSLLGELDYLIERGKESDIDTGSEYSASVQDTRKRLAGIKNQQTQVASEIDSLLAKSNSGNSYEKARTKKEVAAKQAELNTLDSQISSLNNELISVRSQNIAQEWNAKKFEEAMQSVLRSKGMTKIVVNGGQFGSNVTEIPMAEAGQVKMKDGRVVGVGQISTIDLSQVSEVLDAGGHVLAQTQEFQDILRSQEAARQSQVASDANGTMAGVSLIVGTLKELIGSLAYYASIAPAILGIGAGTLSILKAAIALLQFGAKVSIMVNVGTSVASIFSGLFMFFILFQKTEQYAYTYMRFLMSIIIATFGIHFVMSTIGSGTLAATESIRNTVHFYLVKGSIGGKVGSIPLFKASCAAGLAAFGVGMVVEFIADICKTTGQVVQGILSGGFQLS